MAEAALIAYGLGLLGFILVKVLTPGYFARQDTRTPVRIAVYALVLNMALNVVLVVTLVRTNFHAPHAGLAMATTISALFNAGLLYRGLRRRSVYSPERGWGRLALQVLVSGIAMVFAVAWIRDAAGDWLLLSVAERVGWLAVCVFAGMAAYFCCCFLLGLRWSALRKSPAASQNAGTGR